MLTSILSKVSVSSNARASPRVTVHFHRDSAAGHEDVIAENTTRPPSADEVPVVACW